MSTELSPQGLRRPNQRRTKLIRPRLQLGLTSAFTLIALTALCLQSILVTSHLVAFMTEAAQGGPDGLTPENIPGMVWVPFAISAACLLPISWVVGIGITHRFAGPVYHLEKFLGEVRDGKAQRPCRLRKGDGLQDLCERINEVTAPLLQAQGPATEAPASSKSSSNSSAA